MNTRVLVTGFEPFGGESVNPALEAVQLLEGRTIETASGDIELFTQAVPTVFGKSVDVLDSAIAKHQPHVVICVGQAGGRSQITPERVAINVDDARIPDNDGNDPIDTPIVPGGPVAYWTKLPVKRLVQSLQQAGIPASLSNTAGTYVCNHIFYGLMHLLDTKYRDVRGGFVHIPFLPEQVVDRDYPSMGLDTIVKGLEIIITTTVLHETDVAVTAGTES